MRAAVEQAMRNSNMGQVDAYRTNHLISLVEKVRAESAAEIANLIADNRNLLTNLHTAEEAIEQVRAEERERIADWLDGMQIVREHAGMTAVENLNFMRVNIADDIRSGDYCDAAIRAPDREPEPR